MKTFREFTQLGESVSTEPKTSEQVNPADLPRLLGKGAFNSVIKHPWMKEFASYHHAWKHGIDRAGFHEVELYPYFADAHRTADGKIRPTTMIKFVVSHFGKSGKVVQAHKYSRPQEPSDVEKQHGPSAGWKHIKSWKDNE